MEERGNVIEWRREYVYLMYKGKCYFVELLLTQLCWETCLIMAQIKIMSQVLWD